MNGEENGESLCSEMDPRDFPVRGHAAASGPSVARWTCVSQIAELRRTWIIAKHGKHKDPENRQGGFCSG